MCSYEPRDPCNFSMPPAYQIYSVDPRFERFCWAYENQYVCSCRTELCNGDIKLMQSRGVRIFLPFSTTSEIVQSGFVTYSCEDV
ncbi:hypothetical protein Y032_0011g1257 [Ancylostoma ceylanicum]|uniref:Uncharacterized protein n=1 Tax=Ancylostoma ceylanicum TaxID=53326 RepID=A0A016VDT5_9BILA|nr:hypothetical protein Y032_0011g1257 [Ancylostoma ceylanicum]